MSAEAIQDHPAMDQLISTDGFVTVVSGLPRSGTSLMMQMLKAGGLEPFTDDVRNPDEDNPRGYFELENVKRLRDDQSWVPDARGKAVKIIVQLLQYLPKSCGYRVIYMDRDLEEVLRSQAAMLKRSGAPAPSISQEQLRAVFQKQVQATGAMLAELQTPVLKIDYRACVASPAEAAAKVNEFLGGRLDEQSMAAAVDPTLYRQRAAGS